MNNLNTLTRRGDSYPEAGTIPTMSSLQMVDYINADRKSGQRRTLRRPYAVLCTARAV